MHGRTNPATGAHQGVIRPTLGAGRLAEIIAGRWIVLSASGVSKILRRHNLSRRVQRVGALAQLTATMTGVVTEASGPYGFCHWASRPGELVACDSFYVGHLKGVGKVWQHTAVDTRTRWAVAELIVGPNTAATAAAPC